MAKQKRSGSGFLWGLVIGVAIGATVAWVLTPQPGELAATPMAAGMGGGENPDVAEDAAQPTIADLVTAAADRVRKRYGDAMALGREAYAQSQAEVIQRFNQARTLE